MRSETGITILRADYQPYPFFIPEVTLAFDLDLQLTRVVATMRVVRRPEISSTADLILDGQDLKLESIKVNGATLDQAQYALNDETLTIRDLPQEATLEIISTCCPAENTSLMGLYVSGSSFFTQCEAQGFRKICWFADRPDVMSIYSVTLRADKSRYPVLLSNGNLIAQNDLAGNLHEAIWHDPFAKPCYLFALVAGVFVCREQYVQTKSKREVLLQIYSDPGSENRTIWAMECLIRSLRWDETRFGLELDLDRFMIVAARDFNMGAMENKGLNIFNAAYVLADPATATDGNFQAIEAVIGHEYFHNWTGNRVTCRDWFQLSLKEGLTVFRDQEFTSDMMAQGLSEKAAQSARAIKRIDDVVALRNSQFPEDSGPMAHPIRPESYQEIGNFYTATVYEKGAEVIRMLHTLLGETTFRAGMDEYFRRHDGQAVTCDDFVNAMEFAYQQKIPAASLDIFRRWYSQAGTPRLAVTINRDQAGGTLSLTLSQSCPPVGVEKQYDKEKLDFHIPVKFGLIDAAGQAVTVEYEGNKAQTQLLELTERSNTWHFKTTSTNAVPSILRDFSAPVIVDYKYSDTDLALLSAHDNNAFTRWEAGQELASRKILTAAAHWRKQGSIGTIDATMIAVWQALALDPDLDSGYKARSMALPTERVLLERMDPMDACAIGQVRLELRKQIGVSLSDQLLTLYQQNQTPEAYSPQPGPAGKRALKNMSLGYLTATGHTNFASIAKQQYIDATNMTDRLAALTCLAHSSGHQLTHDILTDFYESWQQENLVIDKWFSVQATAPHATVETIRALMAHPAFTLRNPNRARSVIFAFCLQNTVGFHAQDGSGYEFWTEQVLALDNINPEIAARLARCMDQWGRFIPSAKNAMRLQLERVASHKGLSRNTLEIVSKALSL